MRLCAFLLLLAFLLTRSQGINKFTGQEDGKPADSKRGSFGGYQKALQDKLLAAHERGQEALIADQQARHQGGQAGQGVHQGGQAAGAMQEGEGEQQYEERYTITIQPRSTSCFFLEDLQAGYVLSIHYLVLSTKGGTQMDIGMTLKDPEKRMVPGAYKGRKTEFHFRDHKVEKTGDYELCFNNYFSVMEEKKVVWELEVIGDEEKFDTNDEIQLAVNQTLAEYLEEAQEVRTAVSRVRLRLSKMRQHQWWLQTKVPKDLARLESLLVMIDRWSLGYSCAVLLVGILQVFFLRRLFRQRPNIANMKVST